MRTLRHPATALLLALGLLVTSHATVAASASTDFVNSERSNFIFLFAVDQGGVPSIEFTGLELENDFSDWQVNTLIPNLAIFSDPALETSAPGAGRFTLDFDHPRRTARFEWAEVVFDSVDYVVQGAGAAQYNGNSGRWNFPSAFSAANSTFIDSFFTSLPAATVPLPNSVVLMLSAVAFMGFSRRAGRSGAAGALA
ncbi:MAG: hypothetical protein ACU85V_20250 [Gammaproteobacteria bacterium]